MFCRQVWGAFICYKIAVYIWFAEIVGFLVNWEMGNSCYSGDRLDFAIGMVVT